jgi:cysteine-rich repeat protein
MGKAYYLPLFLLGYALACQPAAPFCGDGLVNLSFEQCDDGNNTNDDGCSSTCTVENETACGNGIIEVGEACDDANADDTDVCLSTCRLAFCGDGLIHSGVEQCDNGTGNSDVTPDACRTTCVLARCGDSILDTAEQCDDGNNQNDDDCLDTCELASCGDGFVRTGAEECDDGAGNSDVAPDACRTTCAIASCGDAILDTGEECDDGIGNSDVTVDACRTTCAIASCGDAILDTGEECDDGNTQGGDTCSGACLIEFVVQIVVGEFHLSLRSGSTVVYGGEEAPLVSCEPR